MSPRAIAAGAVPRARRREHAGGARRDGLPHEPAAGTAKPRATSSRTRSSRRWSTASCASGTRRRDRPALRRRRRHAPPDARVADAAPPRDRRRDCRAGDRRRVGAVRRPAALVCAEADRSPSPRRRRTGERRAQDHRDAVLRVRGRRRSCVGVQREVPFGEPVARAGARDRRGAARAGRAAARLGDPGGHDAARLFITEQGRRVRRSERRDRAPSIPAARSTSCSRSTRSSTR